MSMLSCAFSMVSRSNPAFSKTLCFGTCLRFQRKPRHRILHWVWYASESMVCSIYQMLHLCHLKWQQLKCLDRLSLPASCNVFTVSLTRAVFFDFHSVWQFCLSGATIADLNVTSGTNTVNGQLWCYSEQPACSVTNDSYQLWIFYSTDVLAIH